MTIFDDANCHSMAANCYNCQKQSCPAEEHLPIQVLLPMPQDVQVAKNDLDLPFIPQIKMLFLHNIINWSVNQEKT